MSFGRSKLLTCLAAASAAAVLICFPARAAEIPESIDPIGIAGGVLEDAEAGQDGSSGSFVVAAPNEYLNVHKEPSLSSEIVGKLYTNDIAKVLQDNGDEWTKIMSGDVVGYVLDEYLVKGETAEVLTDLIKTDVATVDASSEEEIIVYRDKDENSRKVATLSTGEQYTVEETDEDGWTKVVTDKGTGYVKSDEVNVAPSYPVAESTEQRQERLENSTIVDLADDAQKRADDAQAVADAVSQQAEEARNSLEEEEGSSASALRAAETLEAASDIAQKNADASQESADSAKEHMQSHRSEMGQAVADFALQFVGNPYVWGGSSLTHGTDCSGFTMAVYANFGVSLPHYDASQRGYGIGISSLADARPGDLICYYGHVGIYIGDGQIVHAANRRDGIKVSRADYMTIAAIRRIFY